MDCQRCLSLMDDILDESAAQEQQAWFNGHISECSECRACFEASLTIQNAAPGMIVEPPEELLANVMFRLGEGRKSGRRFVFGRFTAIAATAAALVMAVYFGGLLPGRDKSGDMLMLTGGVAAPAAMQNAADADAGGGEIYVTESYGAKLMEPVGEEEAGVPEAAPTLSENQTAQRTDVEVITPVEAVDTDRMNLLWQNTGFQFAGDADAVLSLYVAAQTDDNGTFYFDDGQDWMLVMETAVGTFELFERQYVQLGNVSCTVFNDMEGSQTVSHVIVTVTQTAGLSIYDYVYDTAQNAFLRETVYRKDNINFMGQSAEIAP